MDYKQWLEKGELNKEIIKAQLKITKNRFLKRLEELKIDKDIISIIEKYGYISGSYIHSLHNFNHKYEANDIDIWIGPHPNQEKTKKYLRKLLEENISFEATNGKSDYGEKNHILVIDGLYQIIFKDFKTPEDRVTEFDFQNLCNYYVFCYESLVTSTVISCDDLFLNHNGIEFLDPIRFANRIEKYRQRGFNTFHLLVNLCKFSIDFLNKKAAEGCE